MLLVLYIEKACRGTYKLNGLANPVVRERKKERKNVYLSTLR